MLFTSVKTNLVEKTSESEADSGRCSNVTSYEIEVKVSTI